MMSIYPMTNIHTFSNSQIKQIQSLLQLALAEDHVAQDATSNAVFSPTDTMSAKLVAREKMVVAGQAVLPLLLTPPFMGGQGGRQCETTGQDKI